MGKTVSIGFKQTWKQRADLCIAQGALTNSKRPESFVNGVYPTHLNRGEGCYVWDTNGKKYIDFICGLGANLLGYGYYRGSDFNRVIDDGVCLSLSSTSEVLFAEELKEVFPFIDKIKILKTGSEACTASVRIARSFLGYSAICLSDGYHGWHDEFCYLTPPAYGVTDHDHISKFSMEDLKKYSIPCVVIVEPVITDWSDERRIFLSELREFCTRKGHILIFDEVITGFRFPKLSVSRYWGIEPDLICLGKGVSNGFPISIVGGKKEIMDKAEYFVSSSFAGDRVAIEAARMTLKEVKTKEIVSRMWEEGSLFLEKFNKLSLLVSIIGYPTRGVFKCASDLTKALFFQEAIKSGILFGSSWFWNQNHQQVSDQVLSICKDILTRIENNQVRLEGDLPKLPFAQKVRGS